MQNTVKIIESYRNDTFVGEDGNILSIIVSEGAAIEDIRDFEYENGIVLPEDFASLLLFSNGINLFDIELLPLEEIEYFPDSQIISIHNWGNGDFDCLSLQGAHYNIGSIVFMSHSEENLSFVSLNLREWVLGVIQEVRAFGTLLHPSDYDYRQENGMYKDI